MARVIDLRLTYQSTGLRVFARKSLKISYLKLSLEKEAKIEKIALP